MRLLRPLSKALMFFPIVTLIYDLVNEWFVHARIKLRSLQEWLNWLNEGSAESTRVLLDVFLSPALVSKLMNWPAPLTLLIPPVIIYAIYWIWFQAKGGHGAGKIIFRSHD